MNLLQPMLEFFGLREQPFANTADPAYFFAAPQYKECLFRIWSTIEGGFGPVVVLGPPGMGKTLLMRKLLSHTALEPELFNTAVIASPSPTWTALSLLEEVLDRFGVQSDSRSFSGHLEVLGEYLLSQPERNNILIIDDAQNFLRQGQVELLRLTQNLETPQRKLLNLVIFAQTPWANALQEAKSFTQRANAVFTLSPLSREEAKRLVEYRLRQAGAADPESFFTADALRLVHEHAGGIPRVIINLCRNSLVVAGMAKARPIGPDIVHYTVDKTLLLSEPAAEAPSPEPASAEFEAEAETPPPDTAPKRLGHPHEEQANQLLLRAARQRSG